MGSNFFGLRLDIFRLKLKRLVGKDVDSDIREAIAHRVKYDHVSILCPNRAQLGVGKVHDGNRVIGR